MTAGKCGYQPPSRARDDAQQIVVSSKPGDPGLLEAAGPQGQTDV
jgi:hypothetical protein